MVIKMAGPQMVIYSSENTSVMQWYNYVHTMYTRANETSNVLSLLKYTKSYADTVEKNQFICLDTSTDTTEERPAQAQYNKGFAARKLLTDEGAVN